jgi:hypothetical protein
MKRFTLVVFMFFLSTLVVGCSVLSSGSHSATSYIVPLYSYPGDSYYSNEWRKLFDFDSRGKKVEVIINADNGPGNSRDANFDQAISNLRSKGFHVMGYVYTSYGARSVSDVKTDIDKWFSIYGTNRIDGIFFDEVSTKEEYFSYYSNLTSYVKQTYGNDKVVIFNPGTTVSKRYFSIADKIIVFESPYDGFKNFNYSDYSGIDSDRVCTIVLGVDNKAKLDEVKEKAIRNNSSCLYITSQLDDGSRDSAYFVVSKYMIEHEF